MTTTTELRCDQCAAVIREPLYLFVAEALNPTITDIDVRRAAIERQTNSREYCSLDCMVAGEASRA